MTVGAYTNKAEITEPGTEDYTTVAPNEALSPVSRTSVFRDKERMMMKTIFDEKFDEGVAVGEARGEARGKTLEAQEMVLTVLKVRFRKVPTDAEKTVRAMVDLTALKSLAAHAATCKSLDEFATHLP